MQELEGDLLTFGIQGQAVRRGGEAEIDRLKGARAAKQASKTAADSFFKPKS